MLLVGGAPIDEVDVEHCTPLLWAAFGGHDEVVRLLLRFKANPDLRDESGQTPLHWAARGHAGTVALLLAHGASPDVRDADGRTPAFWAEHEERDDILEMLGGDRNARRPPQPWVVDVEL
uniref:Palmitoyltransferase n=2 Tax=Alexandrium monilatum TaxID=311494 RepID=A0A7S4V8V4_9DINO